MNDDIIRCIQNGDNYLLDKLIPDMDKYNIDKNIFNNLNENEYFYLFYVIYLSKNLKSNFSKKYQNIIDKLMDSNNNYICGWSIYLYLKKWHKHIKRRGLYYFFEKNLLYKLKNIKIKNAIFKEKIFYLDKLYLYPEIKYEKYIIKKYQKNIEELLYYYYCKNKFNKIYHFMKKDKFNNAKFLHIYVKYSTSNKPLYKLLNQLKILKIHLKLDYGYSIKICGLIYKKQYIFMLLFSFFKKMRISIYNI